MQTKLSVETLTIFHHSTCSFKGSEEKLSDLANPYIHVVHVHYILVYSESININSVC